MSASRPTPITIAHSPDADDAFMFHALATGRIPTGQYAFTHLLRDIQTLNEEAARGVHDVTALSFAAYPGVQDRYALLATGASVGEGYGPMVVAPRPAALADLSGREIAVPGLKTTAYLALRLALPDFQEVVTPFDLILDAVRAGRVAAGLVIHEGQLTYGARGLSLVADLGAWWRGQTGLPLPLGGNAIRRDLGPRAIRQIGNYVRQSIRHALDHRAEALRHALHFSRGLDAATGDRFVGMYVNEETIDMSAPARRAVQTLLNRGHAAGLLDRRVTVEFM
ncbi:MAG: ABC transporter substrate-binding protein [Planctomycetes bacterium]|nr:ABC transporter substrate-binding protein [Planctomycetota bacterium]